MHCFIIAWINDNCLLNLDSESGGAGAAGPSTPSNINYTTQSKIIVKMR